MTAPATEGLDTLIVGPAALVAALSCYAAWCIRLAPRTGVRHDRSDGARLPGDRASGGAPRLRGTRHRVAGAGGRRLADVGGRRDRRCHPPPGRSAGPGSHGIRSRCAGGCIPSGRDGRPGGTRSTPAAVGRVRRLRGRRPGPGTGGLAWWRPRSAGRDGAAMGPTAHCPGHRDGGGGSSHLLLRRHRDDACLGRCRSDGRRRPSRWAPAWHSSSGRSRQPSGAATPSTSSSRAPGASTGLTVHGCTRSTPRSWESLRPVTCSVRSRGSASSGGSTWTRWSAPSWAAWRG